MYSKTFCKNMKYVNIRYPLVKGEVEQKKCYLITARTLPVFPFLLKLKTNVQKKKSTVNDQVRKSYQEKSLNVEKLITSKLSMWNF